MVTLHDEIQAEQKKRIWDGAVNADKHARHYSGVANQMKITSMIFSITVLAASSGAIVSLVGEWGSPFLQPVLYAVVALVTITTIVYDFSFRWASALMIMHQCRILVCEWRRVWVMRNSHIDWERVDDLEYRLESLTHGEMLTSKRKNKRIEADSSEFISATFAPD